MQEIISAIDIGTTKICALMAAVTHDSLGHLSLRLLGYGQTQSRGIRRGIVVNVHEVVEAVANAVEACEQSAGQQMTSAYIGIAGSHIGATESRGVSPVDISRGVSNADMQRALEGADAVVLPKNQEVLHTIARSWIVDGYESTQPLGMSAHRLEVDAHIITANTTAVSNLVQCIVTHGIDVDELVLEPLASSQAVLRSEERDMGVAVVDIGGGTTDIAVIVDDCLCYTEVLDVGGHHLTNDIAVSLHTPFSTAEELKLRYGQVLPERVAVDEKVWAKVFGERGERSFSRRFISKVLEARAEEICEQISDKLEASGYRNKVPAGVVLAGGSAQLLGLNELARRTLGMPVRVGVPANIPLDGVPRGLQSPMYATSIGLLLWGLSEDNRKLRRNDYGAAELPDNNLGELAGQATEWLRNLLPG